MFFSSSVRYKTLGETRCGCLSSHPTLLSNESVTKYLCICVCLYSVSKKSSPLKLFAIFSLRLRTYPWLHRQWWVAPNSPDLNPLDYQVWEQCCSWSQNHFLSIKMHVSWFGLPCRRKLLATLWKTTASDCRHACQPAMDILTYFFESHCMYVCCYFLFTCLQLLLYLTLLFRADSIWRSSERTADAF